MSAAGHRAVENVILGWRDTEQLQISWKIAKVAKLVDSSLCDSSTWFRKDSSRAMGMAGSFFKSQKSPNELTS